VGHIPSIALLDSKRRAAPERLAQAPDRVDNGAMRLPGQAREFERTCRQCGYTWWVPRSAHRRRGGISAYSHGPRGLYSVPGNAREVAASEAVSAVDTAYAHCPRCDSERYTQQPVRP
jgi:hypothetical protein